MGDYDDCPTTFAPDGSIIDPVLLRLIEDTDPLPPAALLELATFFNQIRTYTVLADTLLASALLTRAGEPDDLTDALVDTFVENTSDAKKEDPGPDSKKLPLLRRVLIPGTNIGLLIETIGKRSFAVAVSPDPATLSDDSD